MISQKERSSNYSQVKVSQKDKRKEQNEIKKNKNKMENKRANFWG